MSEAVRAAAWGIVGLLAIAALPVLIIYVIVRLICARGAVEGDPA